MIYLDWDRAPDSHSIDIPTRFENKYFPKFFKMIFI